MEFDSVTDFGKRSLGKEQGNPVPRRHGARLTTVPIAILLRRTGPGGTVAPGRIGTQELPL